MEAPSLPEGLDSELKAVRGGFELRWNPKAKVKKAGLLDAYGNPSPAQYDGRWELWDTSPEGVEYKFMTLQNNDGSFKPAGRWVVNLLKKVDPARYGGSVGRMVQALVDDPNQALLEIGDEQFEDFIEQAAKWMMYASAPKQRVMKNLD